MKTIISIVTAFFCLVNSVAADDQASDARPSGAETSSAGNSNAKAANDEGKYQGDRISFPVHITGTGEDDKTYCIPAGTALRALGQEGNHINVRLIKIPFRGQHQETEKLCGEGVHYIKEKRVFQIEEEYMRTRGGNRYGFTYGALVVPYKYHFSGSKSFDGTSSVGPFLGYRFDKNGLGVGMKAIAFVGGAAIRVSRTDEDGNSDDETLAGFSYGVGLLGTIKQDFQLGIVFGQDRVSDGSDYEDNGEWWGAVALGFSFAN